MACSSNLEPMDQDDTPQVSETCGTLDFNLDDELDLEADDLEITEFTRVYGGDKVTDGRQTTSRPKERITISVINSDFNHDPKEDGELSGSQSESDAADMHKGDNRGEDFSRSRTSSDRRPDQQKDIRREKSPVARAYPNPYLELDDAKIQLRASRFGLTNAAATAIKAFETSSQLSEQDLLNLYIRCGLSSDNDDDALLSVEEVASRFRLDSILIRGTNHMNTDDIFRYLRDLGQKPVSLEWINDAMCVVTYRDELDAAKAIMTMSKPIYRDVPVDNEGKTDSNRTKEVDYDKIDEIPRSSISVPIPPGHIWRFGAPCEKAKGILVRFATKSDKKQERSERFSEYYKNHGNPNRPLGGPAGHGSRPLSGPGRNLNQEFVTSQESNWIEDYKYRGPKIKITVVNERVNRSHSQPETIILDDDEAGPSDHFTAGRRRGRVSESGYGAPSSKKQATLKERLVWSKQSDAFDSMKDRRTRKRGRNASDEEGRDKRDEDKFGGRDRRETVPTSRRWKDGRVEDGDGSNVTRKVRFSELRMRMRADDEEERAKHHTISKPEYQHALDDDLETAYDWEYTRDWGNHSCYGPLPTGGQIRIPVLERLGVKRSPVRVRRAQAGAVGEGLPKFRGCDEPQENIETAEAEANNEDQEDEEDDEEAYVYNLIHGE